jgi:hypothetical protein
MHSIDNLLTSFELAQKEKTTFAALREQLITEIDYLINHKFSQLVFLLYKLDVNEVELENCLKNTSEHTSPLIADLILERQTIKLASRKKFKANTEGIADADLL